MSRQEMVKAITPFYKERKTDLWEMSLDRLRKLMRVVEQEAMIKIMKDRS
jgi:hypothetical protein